MLAGPGDLSCISGRARNRGGVATFCLLDVDVFVGVVGWLMWWLGSWWSCWCWATGVGRLLLLDGGYVVEGEGGLGFVVGCFYEF